MASHKAFVDYITEQLGGAGEIRAKPMFGEYGLYCDGQLMAEMKTGQRAYTHLVLHEDCPL